MTASETQKRWWIYVLIETRPDHELFGQPRYVGWTIQPKHRFSKHLQGAKRKRNRNECWIYASVQAGSKPVMRLVESGIGGTWQEAECRWIAWYRALGYDLTNATDGGQGGVPNEETRLKISRAKKGKPVSLETRENMSAAHKGKPLSQKTRENMSAARMGRVVSDETRAKISAALKARYEKSPRPWPPAHGRHGKRCHCRLCLDDRRDYQRIADARRRAARNGVSK